MAKYAIKVKEIFSKTIIVNADNFEEAKEKVKEAYVNEKIKDINKKEVEITSSEIYRNFVVPDSSARFMEELQE